MLTAPRTAISSATTTKVYVRLSASRTIHIAGPSRSLGYERSPTKARAVPQRINEGIALENRSEVRSGYGRRPSRDVRSVVGELPTGKERCPPERDRCQRFRLMMATPAPTSPMPNQPTQEG